MIAPSSKITLIIPTLNRSGFISRLLHYYETLSFQGRIFIADSSTSSHVERTKALVHRMKDKLRIVHQEFPGLRNDACFRLMNEIISTPYVVSLADDDFLIPRGLDQCIEFLESNRDYIAAHGIGIVFNLDSAGPFGGLVSIGKYEGLRSVEEESGIKRLFGHMSNYSVTQFSVHRTIAWRTMWRFEIPSGDLILGTELLPCSLSAILGKVKKLGCLYLVRQIHHGQFRHLDLFDWIAGSNWQSSYQASRDCLAEELVRQDGITLEEAREVVKQAFWSYLAQGLMGTWQARYVQDGSTLRSRLREMARHIPGLRTTWHNARSFVPGENNKMTLPALLRPSSPYHDDFMPIYRAVTTPVPELNELRPE